MINLIPPAAKKVVQREYWMRVAVMSLLLLSGVCLLLIALQIPTYILISSQKAAYESQASAAQLAESDYKKLTTVITETNTLAQHLDVMSTEQQLMPYVAALDSIAGSRVTIKRFAVTRGIEDITIEITGTALDRLALAAFSDAVAQDPLFIEANVPISNLAKESDIPFTIAVTPAPRE